MEMKLYTVETVRTIWENNEIAETCTIGMSHFTDFAAAKRRAEMNHKTGMDLHLSSKDGKNHTSTDIWVNEYEQIGNEFIYKCLRGHYTSSDAVTAPLGFVCSHCE